MEQIEQLKAMREAAMERLAKNPDYKLVNSLDNLIGDLERAFTPADTGSALGAVTSVSAEPETDSPSGIAEEPAPLVENHSEHTELTDSAPEPEGTDMPEAAEPLNETVQSDADASSDPAEISSEPADDSVNIDDLDLEAELEAEISKTGVGEQPASEENPVVDDEERAPNAASSESDSSQLETPATDEDTIDQNLEDALSDMLAEDITMDNSDPVQDAEESLADALADALSTQSNEQKN